MQTEPKPSMISRRALLSAGVVAVTALGVGWATRPRASFEGSELSVEAAFEAARAGKVLLVDIRRPDEWARTGIGAGAHPLDMRRRDFVDALDGLTGANKDLPIALICARGVRSARLSALLTEAGYTRIINVPEGMLGSRAGPGWIARGLPLMAYKG